MSVFLWNYPDTDIPKTMRAQRRYIDNVDKKFHDFTLFGRINHLQVDKMNKQSSSLAYLKVQNNSMIAITPAISINEKEITLHFIRSSGPGGQNVNKVATAVQLRFDPGKSPSLPPEVRTRLVGLAGNRINREGILIIEARKYRTQERNRDDAIGRLVNLIRRAAEKPKMRIKTKPSRGSKERRMEHKKQRGTVKKTRRIPELD
jgi:ribosome-associated protein